MVTCIDLMYNILQCFSIGWIIIYCVSKHSSFCWCNYIFHSSCLHHRMVVIKAPHAYRRLSEWNEDYLQSAYIWTLALLVYHFMFGPEYHKRHCPTCSANADGFNGLHRAPLTPRRRDDPMYTSTESVHQERDSSKETQQFCQGYFRRV